jgi:hypothetical protein
MAAGSALVLKVLDKRSTLQSRYRNITFVPEVEFSQQLGGKQPWSSVRIGNGRGIATLRASKSQPGRSSYLAQESSSKIFSRETYSHSGQT